MRNFYIDGVSSATYNIFASGENTYNAAERDVSSIEVPGRNGNLLVDNGRFKNVDVKYPCVIPYGFKSNANSIRAWLMSNSFGYHKITDDYDVDHFRMGRYVGGIEFSPMYSNQAAATFNLTFDCKPQRFLNSGEEMVGYRPVQGQGYTIENPTMFNALPYIQAQSVVAGTTLMIANSNIKFLNAGLYQIDCETREISWNNSPGGEYVEIDEFPVFTPGVNRFGIVGGIGILYIEPRWWEL